MLVLKKLRMIAIVIIMSGCVLVPRQPVIKIALLAPFEGRYREVGYDALYAARLAMAEHAKPTTDLLAIDDGGHIGSAIDRAQAIQQDPDIQAIIILGPYATQAAVQQVFEKKPVLIVGHWNTQPVNSNVSLLANPEIDSLIDANQSAEIVTLAESNTAVTGSEILALQQLPHLADSMQHFTILSSALLPDAAFTERYLASDPFAQNPGLLAPLTYDATALVIHALENHIAIENTNYQGINGHIQFKNGYWANAPINRYVYDESNQLVPTNP